MNGMNRLDEVVAAVSVSPRAQAATHKSMKPKLDSDNTAGAVAQELLVRRSSPQCKHGEPGCGQYYDCGKCAREKRAAAYRRLTPEQKAYDQVVDPLGACHTDFPEGCSCHICAPCSFCASMTEEEADAYAKSFSTRNTGDKAR